MGRLEFEARRGAVLFYVVFATVSSALIPLGARAQTSTETAEQPIAPAQAAPPSAPNAVAPPQDSTPTRKPWREAMERAPAAEGASVRMERVWYGWQTIIVDLSGVGLIALGAAEDEVGLAVAGLIVVGIGSPIVHFAHQNISAGAISFAIRATSIGLLFLGGVLLSEGLFSDDETFDSTQQVVGTIAAIASIPGALAAMIIDASLLAYDVRPREPQRSSLTPWIDPRRGNYGLRFALSL